MARSKVGRASGAVARLFGSATRIQAAGRFLRGQVWAWPVLAATLFGGAGWWVYHAVENVLREQRTSELNAMVEASATAVQVWLGEQRINVQLFAEDEQLLPPVKDLLRLDDGSPEAGRKLTQAPSQDALRARLKPLLRLSGYVGYFVVSPGGTVLASDQDPPIGKGLSGYRKAAFDHAIAGQTHLTRPYPSPLLLADEKGELRSNLPTMFTIGPLRDEKGRPIAALGLRIRPEDQFTRILQVVRFGDSGETFAFDRTGLLLSQSRFDGVLKQIGLLADQPDARSILTVEIRDPGVNMVEGGRPKLRRPEQPLTRMAEEAVQGINGHDADGYSGYCGEPRVGAWRWLPEYDFGVATEVNAAEAFRPAYILRRAFWGLMTLLALCAVGIFLVMLVLDRQQRALQKATLAARQLGQYTLEEKLGAGGMGTVYKARHALLRRPTAVKLLDVDKMSHGAVERFEREVQLTAALTHPNTVAVFDYGRTPDDIFYYAMEYLEGMNLDDLVLRFGPVPEARLVYILRQVCGSLAEAHTAGLVHRDVKPANIFLTRRGGLHDFVKVLDFGLAKALEGPDRANLTSHDAVVGTPLYLSPEAVSQTEAVDARADVYAVGAVGYFLLTGTPVFTGATVMEICMKHVRSAPEPPSARLGRPVSPTLEVLLLRCLAKSPTDRPGNAGVLLGELEACTLEGRWTPADAAAWWASTEHSPTASGQGPSVQGKPAPDQKTPSPDATIAYEVGSKES